MIIPNFFSRGQRSYERLNEFIGFLLLGKRAPAAAATNVTTASAVTFTAAQLRTGFITRDPNGAARADLVDTAANLIAAAGLNLTADGQEAQCLITNTADAAETITITTNTGITLKGTITIEQSCAVRLAFVRTSATTVSVRQI
jgi:hypothetical protein